MTGIVTATPAAAIDRTYTVQHLGIGQVNRADAVHTELSGKGVNVARAVALTGTPVSAVLPLGPLGRLVAEQESARQGREGDILAIVPTPGHTRVNTTIVDAGGDTTKVNEAAVPLRAEEWDALVSRSLVEIARLHASWFVLAGTMPRLEGTAEEVPFVDLLHRARAAGARVAVDTAGAALRTVTGHLDAVSLVKPNTQELAELVGRPLASVGDVVGAARELCEAGCETVYVSMGADGALVVTEHGVWRARAAARAVNTAGAGDASLAGFLVGAMSAGDSAPDAVTGVRRAASWGALAVTTATTVLTTLDGAPDAEVVADPDPMAALSEPALP